MSHERIDLKDNLNDVVFKLSEGNAGAVRVLVDILKQGVSIDPDSGFGQPIFILLNMDTAGIYGPNIWKLFKHVCGERLDKTIAIVRAHQLGLVGTHQLLFSIDNRGAGLDVNGICLKVKEQLPSFTFTEGPLEK